MNVVGPSVHTESAKESSTSNPVVPKKSYIYPTSVSESVLVLTKFLSSMLENRNALDCIALRVVLYWVAGRDKDVQSLLLSTVVLVVEIMPPHADLASPR